MNHQPSQNGDQFRSSGDKWFSIVYNYTIQTLHSKEEQTGEISKKSDERLLHFLGHLYAILSGSARRGSPIISNTASCIRSFQARRGFQWRYPKWNMVY